MASFSLTKEFLEAERVLSIARAPESFGSWLNKKGISVEVVVINRMRRELGLICFGSRTGMGSTCGR